MVKSDDIFYYPRHLKYFVTDNGVGIHNFGNDEYYFLENLSEQIWLGFDGKNNVSQIVGQLMEQYEVEKEQLESDVKKFIQKLLDNNLLENVGV